MKTIKETKSERVNLHLTPTSKSIILEKAKVCNMNMTNYLTACAITQTIYVIGDKESLNDISYQLKKIGSNINQLRMLSNFGKLECINFDEFTKSFVELNNTVSKLIKRTTKWQP